MRCMSWVCSQVIVLNTLDQNRRLMTAILSNYKHTDMKRLHIGSRYSSLTTFDRPYQTNPIGGLRSVAMQNGLALGLLHHKSPQFHFIDTLRFHPLARTETRTTKSTRRELGWYPGQQIWTRLLPTLLQVLCLRFPTVST